MSRRCSCAESTEAPNSILHVSRLSVPPYLQITGLDWSAGYAGCLLMLGSLTSTTLETRSLSMPLVEDNENMNHHIINRQPPLPEHSTRSPNPNQVLPPPRKQPEQTHDKKETPCTSLLHGARVTTSRNSLDRIGRGLPDLLRGCAYADESEILKHRRPPPPGHAAKHHTQEPELSLEVGRQAGQGQGGES